MAKHRRRVEDTKRLLQARDLNLNKVGIPPTDVQVVRLPFNTGFEVAGSLGRQRSPRRKKERKDWRTQCRSRCAARFRERPTALFKDDVLKRAAV